MLESLSGNEYLAKPGANSGFILKHSVGSFPHNSEIDVPLIYADYYFLEALLRYQKLKGQSPALSETGKAINSSNKYQK